MKRTFRKGIVISAAAVALSALVACQPKQSVAQSDAAPERAGWTYVGGDEFNGSSLDPANWKAYHNTYGDGNNELACLTPANVKETGGILVIASQRETVTCPSGSVRKYTSGFIGSREAGRYYPMFGRFEMRARVPHAQGLWPAFWLRHRRGAGVAEVDVLEYFHSQVPGKGTATLHLDGRRNLLQKSVFFESPQNDGQFHTWAVEISPVGNDVKFEFFLDDRPFGSYVDTQHNWKDGTDPNATWDIAVNQAVGGNWTGDPDGVLGYLPGVGRCSIGGTAPSGCVTTGINRVDWSDLADVAYLVDYVRVYTRS